MTMRAPFAFHHPTRSRHFADGQRGVALAVSLFLLILVTLIGLAAIRGTTIQQRMTANFYDREIAFQSAEAGLRAGEAYLSDPGSPLVDGVDFRNCQDGDTCLANPFADSGLGTGFIKTVDTDDYDVSDTNAPGQPQFVIELICLNNACSAGAGSTGNCQSANCQSYGTENTAAADFAYYRITARSGDPGSEAGTNRAVVILQAVFQVPLS